MSYVFALLLSLSWVGVSHQSAATSDEYKIVVHPGNPATVVSREFLQAAFLKKVTHWVHGVPVHPVDMQGELRFRERFVEEVLRKTPSQLRVYWAQRIFSGTGTPPLAVDSAAAMIARVRADPGAVGFLPLNVDADGAKVLSLQ